MDSPRLQSSPQLQRLRTNSNLSVQSAVDNRGAIRRRSTSRARSVSNTQADRLYNLSLENQDQLDPASLGVQWFTPQHSPQPQTIFSDPSLEPFPTWTVPTPPRSDSGVPTVSVDANDKSAGTGISASQDLQFEQPTTSVEMSSLGFLLPSQYGSGLYESEPSSYTMEPNYIPPMRMSQPATRTSASAYSHTISSSPALYQSKTAPLPSSTRRHSELPSGSTDPSYNSSYRRISNPYDSSANNDYSVTPGQTIPSISGLTHSPMPSPSPALGSSSATGGLSSYNSRSPSMYDPTIYGQPYTTAPSSTQLYSSSQSLSYPPPFVGSSVNEVLAKPLGSETSIRVLNQRPKPQCWDHGCNGRQFSTFSNLLRHQREKSGTAAKSYCPKCGAEFTRTTARNGHLAHDKCTKQQQQQRRQSDDK